MQNKVNELNQNSIIQDNLAKEVKTLTVVTTDKDKFNMLVKELYQQYGIILKVVEKSTTNMQNANVIVNVDFPSYDMNKLSINQTSLVICGFAEHYEKKKNFDYCFYS